MHDWDAICREYGPLVWRTAFQVLNHHADALDCYQSVMLEAFERTRDRLVEDWPSLLRWLAARRAIDHLRKRRSIDRRLSPIGDVNLLPTSTHNRSEEPLELAELIDGLCRELPSLPEQQAQAFWLAEIEGMTYAEIARQMKLSANHVGVLLSRARNRLRTALAGFHLTPGK